MRRAPGFLICRSVALALGLCAALCTSAAASPRYRIVLTSGQQLVSETCAPDYRLEVLRLEVPGPRWVSFNRVRSVFDGDRDVTREFLEGVVHRFVPADSSGLPAHWVTEKSAVYKAATRPRWRLALAAGGNFSAPFGDYFAAYAAGFGFDAAALLPLDRHLALRGSVSRSGGRFGDVLEGFGQRTRLLRYTLSLAGYTPLSGSPSDRSLAYSYAGVGALSERQTARGTATTDNHFLLTVGGGLLVAVTRHVGAEIGLSWDEVFLRDHLFEASLVDLKSSLVLMF